MAFALVVLLVPVALLLALYRCAGNEDPVAIDPGPAYDAARADKRFPVREPAGLGDDWVVQSASYRAGILRVGLLTPARDGVLLIQASELLTTQLGTDATAEGTVDVDGRTWQRYAVGEDGRRALVLVEPGLAVILVGDADESELRTLAAAL